MFDAEMTPSSSPCPRTAWIFHKDREDITHAISQHEILADGADQPMIGAGKPLDERSVELALESLRGNEGFAAGHRGLLPSNLLQYDATKLTWFVPGQMRRLWFHSNLPRLRRTYVDVPWPNLVFHVSEELGFRLWTVRARRRPTESTRLHHAPFPNCYANGKVCLGTAPRGTIDIATCAAWEEAVFGTRFSTIHHHETIRDGKQSGRVSDMALRRFWCALERSGDTRFPIHRLSAFTPGLSRARTLGEVLP